MEQLRGVWYIGFICKGCDRFQAVLLDPTEGDPTRSVNEGTLWARCEACLHAERYGPDDIVRQRGGLGEWPMSPRAT
jgi:hypothetical protein